MPTHRFKGRPKKAPSKIDATTFRRLKTEIFREFGEVFEGLAAFDRGEYDIDRGRPPRR